MFQPKNLVNPLNPILRTSFIGKFFFTWVTEILRLGLVRTIVEDDIYAPLEEHTSKIVANRFRFLWLHEVETHIHPSLFRLLLKEFGYSVFISNVFYSACETVFRIIQLYSFGGLVSYFSPDQTTITKDDAFIYALGMSGSTIVIAVIYHPFKFYNFKRSLKIRVGLSSLIYDTILKQPKSTTTFGTDGQEETGLILNDVSKFDVPLSMVYIVWKGPIDAIIFGYILFLEIGISAVYAVIFLTFFIPVQIWISKRSAMYRQEASKRTDRRVKFMNEILQGIQVIKMYAWEKSFARIVKIIRSKEIKALRGLYNTKAGTSSLYAISNVSIFLCLISYVYLDERALAARQVFMVASVLIDLNLTMVYYWPMAISEVISAYVSSKRITSFLILNRVNQMCKSQSNTFEGPTELTKLTESNDLDFSQTTDTSKCIQFKNVSAVWPHKDSSFTLESINLSARMNDLYAIIGRFGSGKTSLLSLITGELKPTKGNVNIIGIVSYASSEPWLFDGTIRQNIIFIDPYDEKRYEEVCRVCTLDTVFEQLPFKDLTLVGERGIALSSAHKTLVSLARAIYRKADIYLLDDPLSSVDDKMGKNISSECIQKYLNGKCVVLVTNQVQYLQTINNVILMSDGRITAKDAFKELSQLNCDFLSALSNQNNLNSPEDETKCPYVQETKKLITQLEAVKSQDENLMKDSTSYQIYLDYLRSVKSTRCLILMSILIVLYQLSLMGIDYFLALWVNWEESINSKNIINTIPSFPNIEYNLNSTISVEIINEVRHHYIFAFALLTLYVVYVQTHTNFAIFSICLKASENLHNNLFRGISYATVLFFSSNPSDRILNRFVRDIQVMDIQIPNALNDTVQCFLQLFCTGLVVSIINPWALLPTVVFSITIVGLRAVYIKTLRSFNRIRALTGSPIWSQIKATIQGLTTIRSFNAQEELILRFGEHLNVQSGAMYLYNAVTTALAVWIDTANRLYVVFVLMSCLLLPDSTQAGTIGFIISKVISLVAVTQWGIRQSVDLENCMVSVEKIMEYSNLEQEPDCFEKHPPDAWPQFGTISFSNVSFKYGPDKPYVLKNIYFEIKSQEKIGIIGRTGAGKSSIMQALFRLGFIDGLIYIDRVNIATLPLQYLRKNLSIIPQDPVLFSGSIRNNLDPFRNKSDTELWLSLEHVQMKSIISALPDGLEFRISEGSRSFSLGQRQLLCLARAILRKTKIVILDEATANVDPKTDKLIQTAVRNNLAQCTVLTVAHRLHSVLDYDRILVMDSGRIVEFDTPVELLKKSDGHLRKLFDQSTALVS